MLLDYFNWGLLRAVDARSPLCYLKSMELKCQNHFLTPARDLAASPGTQLGFCPNEKLGAGGKCYLWPVPGASELSLPQAMVTDERGQHSASSGCEGIKSIKELWSY